MAIENTNTTTLGPVTLASSKNWHMWYIIDDNKTFVNE